MTDISYQPQTQEAEASLGDYFALLKPRVMSLVVFTALVGLLAAPVSVHPVIAFASILFVAIGAGASGALNMWWDADIDAVMTRTSKRPIPSGKVTPDEAKVLGVALSGMSVVMLALSANLLAAGLLAFTIFFYAVIYSMWLKRSTPQNIVIRWCSRRVSTGHRVGYCHRLHVRRSVADVRTDLYVDPAAFLGTGSVHEIGL